MLGFGTGGLDKLSIKHRSTRTESNCWWLVTWVNWWEVSWGEVCCATDLDLGFPPGGSLAVASSLGAREPPVLQEEVEGRLGREGEGEGGEAGSWSA